MTKIMQAKFNIGVFAIITNKKDEVLLCHRRDYDLWNLPGGKLEAEEAPWEGVVREVREETGLTVSVTSLAGIYHKPEKNEIIFSFCCRVTGGTLAPTAEADQIRYFSTADIPTNTPAKQLERITDALNSPSTPIMKIQRGPASTENLHKKS